MNKKIANYISDLFNPALLALVILLAATYKSDFSAKEVIGWYVTILVLNGLVPTVVYFFFTSKGYRFDDSLENKEVHKERIIIFLVLLAITGFELFFMLISNQLYQPLYAVLVGGMVSITIATIISYFWKVSLHSSLITFFVAMVILLFGYTYWPVISLIPLVWWARLSLNKHTIWQLVVGAALSFLIIFLVFNYFNLP